MVDDDTKRIETRTVEEDVISGFMEVVVGAWRMRAKRRGSQSTPMK